MSQDSLYADEQELGGITEWQKCAHYVAANHVPIAPHRDQEVHVPPVTAVRNDPLAQYYDGALNALEDTMFCQQLALNADKTVTAPTQPGPGFDLNHPGLERYRANR